jgi:hypothetical protein
VSPLKFGLWVTKSFKCVTWFKRNKPDGRVITLYPGSALASYKGWESPRWEDYEYESWLGEDNTLAYLGNGFTHAEQTQDWDSTTKNYMDLEDESTVLLRENPVFVSPKLHEEPYHLAELNPGIVDLNIRVPSALAGKTAPVTNGAQTSKKVEVEVALPLQG